MKKYKLALVLLFILLITLGIHGYRSVTGSSEGSISPVVIEDEQPDTTSTRIAVNNDYANFTYPAKFTVLGADKPVAPILANYNFLKRQIGSWQIGIQIGRLSNARLSDEGSYNYRNTTPSRFTKSERRIGANDVVIFSDNTSTTFSKTGFLQQQGLFGSIYMSGGTSGNYNQLQADFDAIIESWNWR